MPQIRLINLKNFQTRKGFALIEIIIAIAIIGILATVGVVVYSSAQKSAKIQKRSEDLKALMGASSSISKLPEATQVSPL